MKKKSNADKNKARKNKASKQSRHTQAKSKTNYADEARKHLAPNVNQSIVIRVDKSEVEERNIGGFKNVFERKQKELGNLDNTILISFEGYDSDPRDVWDIEECVNFYYGICTLKGAMRSLKIYDPTNMANYQSLCMAKFMDKSLSQITNKDKFYAAFCAFLNLHQDSNNITFEDNKYMTFTFIKHVNSLSGAK